MKKRKSSEEIIINGKTYCFCAECNIYYPKTERPPDENVEERVERVFGLNCDCPCCSRKNFSSAIAFSRHSSTCLMESGRCDDYETPSMMAKGAGKSKIGIKMVKSKF